MEDNYAKLHKILFLNSKCQFYKLTLHFDKFQAQNLNLSTLIILIFNLIIFLSFVL